ncbi:MAG: bifunctional oligoribonuclease/PAP phosphatase NrnA [Bacilli bacterium]|nr:bifunctional oligoribonuclease/PAP phosphatase NrnA [Bacilli bacterium]
MYKDIYKTIKSYNNIVIARHVGVDPDAMASSMALRDSIKLTFPDKNVYAIGNGTVKLTFMGPLDKGIDFDQINDILLIVVDTPDKRRVDMEDLTHYEKSIKIDHHPFVEKFCDIEVIDDEKSSASEMIYDLICSTPLKMNKRICEAIFAGVVGDTNRFLFNNSKPETFSVIADMIRDYGINITKVYYNLYKRPLSEVKFFGYMADNIETTDNGVGYIIVKNDTLTSYNVDSATAGNLINEFNNIGELLVWLSATEDVKNGFIRVSARSRGPIINKVLEKHGGGGHALASGAKVKTFEDVEKLIKDLDNLCKEYSESSDE